MTAQAASSYRDAYQNWQRDPEGFWRDAATAIDWIKPPATIFDARLGRLWPLVPRCGLQYVLERGRSARSNPWRATRDHL